MGVFELILLGSRIIDIIGKNWTGGAEFWILLTGTDAIIELMALYKVDFIGDPNCGYSDWFSGHNEVGGGGQN